MQHSARLDVASFGFRVREVDAEVEAFTILNRPDSLAFVESRTEAGRLAFRRFCVLGQSLNLKTSRWQCLNSSRKITFFIFVPLHRNYDRSAL